MLSNTYLNTYRSMLDIDISSLLAEVQSREWTPDNFKFFTAVSVMSSSRIEGEQLEVDSYVKHKMLDIEYLPNLTEKPNDLYLAYEFARDNELSQEAFSTAHTIATLHLLPAPRRGTVRSGNMVIMDQQTNSIQYEAALASIVTREYARFWKALSALLEKKMSCEEVFYYAALIHLVFVKIHPFNDGNGRTGRLLEKWFLASKLGEKAWYISSERYYYQHLQSYYNNLARIGLFYDELNYDKAVPFLLMLPNALIIKK